MNNESAGFKSSVQLDRRPSSAFKGLYERRAGIEGKHKAWLGDRWRYLFLSLAFLPVLLLLSDVPSVNAERTYNHAEQNFIHGYLEESQYEADQGYRRFLYSDPLWARRFQLLEANAMVWRGLNERVLTTLADDRTRRVDADEEIQKLALQATALTGLHRFVEAASVLSKADELCALVVSNQCGTVLRAHGQFYRARGLTVDAQMSFRASLEFARAHEDGLLEATALMNLGRVASESEHHDEAAAYYEASARKATELGAADIEQRALGSEGWEQQTLGNSQRALEVFAIAEKAASSLGDITYEINWLATSATAYASLGNNVQAEKSDLQAIDLARTYDKKQAIIEASMDLAQLYINEGRSDDADRPIRESVTLIKSTGNEPDMLTCHLLQGKIAALRHYWIRADSLLHEVSTASESVPSMRWDAEHALANMYVAEGRPADAGQAYKAALAIVEGARGSLEHEASQLPFLANAARIYDDYIDFLVAQGMWDEALKAADWSRARTLQQGLGVIPAKASPDPPPLQEREIARGANATLLFYWMGEKHSYLWAINPEKGTVILLPAKSEIVSRMQRYRRTLLALKDPLRDNNRQGDKDGRELYDMLVAPVAHMISPDRQVILFTDGEMSQLNFETLLAGSPTPHYWIEDATISSAPSIRLLAAKHRSARPAHDRLLLFGDSVSADPSLPHLPMAALEIQKVRDNFRFSDEAVFAGAQATPLAYLGSKPEQFSYIHFVAHATASSTDPLESAVLLSRDDSGEDSYKLYAREILQHPISARLVTISACNSSGTASIAGEGAVGLSWAFLRAGAHNTIGALWDVSDESTPELMDHLYAGLQKDQAPAAALRNAKLALLHSDGNFKKPFYWAPFQLYSGH